MTPAGSRWQELAWLLASPLPSLHFPDSRCGCLELISTFSADVSSWMSHRHPVQHDPPLPGGTLFTLLNLFLYLLLSTSQLKLKHRICGPGQKPLMVSLFFSFIYPVTDL